MSERFATRANLAPANELWDGAKARYLMVDAPACKPLRTKSTLERKQLQIWTNPKRNELIAQVAMACQEGNRNALRGFGIHLSSGMHCSKRVVVIVESTAHGRELLALLPEWKLLAAAPVEYADNYEPEEPDETDAIKGRIVTLVYAARYGIAADILVRATGGRGSIPLDTFALNLMCNPLVIDFADRGSLAAEQESRHRVRCYDHGGWRALKVNPQPQSSQ